MTDALHPRLHVCDHPLIRHKLARMRDRGTGTRAFRALLKEIAMLMGYEVMRDLPLAPVDVETPMAMANASTLEGKKLAIVPILRAGLGMADGFLELIPPARVGHIGLYRDHVTKRPVEYLRKLPEADDRLFIIVDPMLATGYSAAAAVDAVKAHGVGSHLIRFVALVAAPEGLAVMAEKHADVPVFVAAVDDGLDENAYIVPGLGDAGDRLFGTK